MNGQILLLILIYFSITFVPAQTTIAVMDFEARNILAGEAATLTDRFRDELIKTGKYSVIERGQMEEVLKEQGFQQSGCISDECVVEIGQLIGVQQIVGGSIGKVGNVYSVSARIIDVQSGKIISVTTYDYSGDLGGLLTVGMRQVVMGLISDKTPQVISKPQDIGSLYINSEPTGADVWIDGIQVSGITPLMADNQSAGKHEILARKGDYSSTQTTKVKKDDVTKVNLRLKLGRGILKVVSNPYEAKVFINGTEKGSTPLIVSNLKAGDYNIKIKHDGHSPYEQTVYITSNTTKELNIDLEKLVVFTIKSNPSGAKVFIDSEPKGQTPVTISLLGGDHLLSLQKTDHYQANSIVTLKPGVEESKEIILKHVVGQLVVESSPAGADVFIYGSKKGVTPITMKEIRTGSITVELKKSGYVSQTRSATITRGTAGTIKVNLMSKGAVEKQIAELKRHKLYYLAGAAGAVATALAVNSLANRNYDKYQTATTDATDLHNTINNQLLFTKILSGVGVGCLVLTIKYYIDETRLQQSLEESK